MDGPAAINNNFTGYGSLGFPIEIVIANTRSKQQADAWGETMGQMCKEMGIEGWYAPAMNTHRGPFGGRNYEYFSEDGVLAGKIGASAVAGASGGDWRNVLYAVDAGVALLLVGLEVATLRRYRKFKEDVA